MDFINFSKEELESMLKDEQKKLAKIGKKGISIDMSRGRPATQQLELAMPMLEDAAMFNYALPTGDARNYGSLGGIRQARELFADLLGVRAENIIVGDGSSLDFMYTAVQFSMQFGVRGSTPWNKLPKVKFICPAPGYDRHFAICEELGIEMITVPMLDDGPDMDLVESLVVDDDSIKGIWCVPKYSNPTGIIYSDKVVERLATMKVAAKDFRIYWDNAYVVHGLYDNNDKLKNIFDVARKAGNFDRVLTFGSTSKISFAGAGIACMGASEENLTEFLRHLSIRTIGPNKVNQVMHVAYLKNVDNIKKIMEKHAELLRPKFELVDAKLTAEFADDDYVKWSKPRGGYFVSLDVRHCAKRIVELAMTVGVKFTPAGSAFPYHIDDNDQNIRIAPSVPTLEELDTALDVLVIAIKIARIELVLKKLFK